MKRVDRRWPMRLWKTVRSGDFDVVHVHSPLPGSVARVAVRSMPRSKRPGVVATEHNRWATPRPPTRLANRLTSRWNDATSEQLTEPLSPKIRRVSGGLLPPKKAPTWWFCPTSAPYRP